MTNQLHYKDYIGRVFFSEEDGVFHGKVIGLSDSISFEGESVKALTEDFHNAIDEYLEFCASVDKQPEKALFQSKYLLSFTIWLRYMQVKRDCR